ncbi:MAG: transporter substrate-binding domain-containing protein [Prevotellaceae bacterium]|jgi:membrane-bound lytic murein transglycosylase MltF|nr:transporter substrate-binding domain-containing protein [Prevotellaceae bacterium]
MKRLHSTKRFLIYLMTTVVIANIALIIVYALIEPHEPKDLPVRDYAEIHSEGVLRAVTEYNMTDYYIANDTASGFHYELIRCFAQTHGLQLEIIPEMSFEKRLNGLWDTTFDVIAYGIPVTRGLTDTVAFTMPITRSKQVLVQRNRTTDSLKYIAGQLDLAQKTLYVAQGSPVVNRIRNLSNEIADTIYVKEIEKYGQEQLLALVANGDIDYAVVSEQVAATAIDSFPQLDISTGISFTQFYAWATRKSAPALCDSLNVWLKDYMQTAEYDKLYHKYYPNH